MLTTLIRSICTRNLHQDITVPICGQLWVQNFHSLQYSQGVCLTPVNQKRLVLYSKLQHDLLLEFGVVLVFHPLCFQMWELRFLSWAWWHTPVNSGGRGALRCSRPVWTTGDLVSKQKQNPNPKHTNTWGLFFFKLKQLKMSRKQKNLHACLCTTCVIC